jgi:hypothetical protein
MDIIKDTEFSDVNVCFKAALAELKRIGKGFKRFYGTIG